ncbi:hypothetical protein GIB67_030887, partial [Kingdonia uniflora]
MKTFKDDVMNKSRPEGCIVHAYLLQETLTYCTEYKGLGNSNILTKLENSLDGFLSAPPDLLNDVDYKENDDEGGPVGSNQEFIIKGIYPQQTMLGIDDVVENIALTTPSVASSDIILYFISAVYHMEFHKRPKITFAQLVAILPLSIVHTMGSLFTNMSLGKVVVSFTHTIKTMEPFFSILLSAMIRHWSPMASNVTFHSCNVLSKKIHGQQKEICGQNNYVLNNNNHVIVPLNPLWLYLWRGLNAKEVCIKALAGGICFHAYQQLAMTYTSLCSFLEGPLPFVRRFSYAEIKKTTGGFSSIIVTHSDGSVYKAQFQGGLVVVVKE